MNYEIDRRDFLVSMGAIATGAGLLAGSSPVIATPGESKAKGEQIIACSDIYKNWLGMEFKKFDSGIIEQYPNPDNPDNPIPEVHVNEALMGIYPITRGQFAKFVLATGYVTEAEDGKRTCVPDLDLLPNGWFAWLSGRYNWRNPNYEQNDDHPVVLVTYRDAKEFCSWLNKCEPCRNYRLPYESEWEYVCRSGATSKFFWGDNPLGGHGYLNAADMTFLSTFVDYNQGGRFDFSDGCIYTSPVGSFQPNPWGFYDMLGNVYELCRKGWPDMNWDVPRARGGAFVDGPETANCSYTNGYFETEDCHCDVGFRVLLELPKSPSELGDLVDPPTEDQLTANPSPSGHHSHH